MANSDADDEGPPIRVRNLFVGVPDALLMDIGRVVMLASQLDLQRLKILAVAEAVLVTDSATWRREQVTTALTDSFKAPLFSDLRAPMTAWLDSGGVLLGRRDELVHSVGGQEIREETSRFVTEHPRRAGTVREQISAEALHTLVWDLVHATDEGFRLFMETGALIDLGPERYRERVAEMAAGRARFEQAIAAARREAEGDNP